MEIFNGENFIKFTEIFSTNDLCKEYLAYIKWNTGYSCRKCRHKKATIRQDHTRTCTLCNHNESASANTAFHNVNLD